MRSGSREDTALSIPASFTIPLRTGRGLNDRHAHWGQRHSRVATERDAIRLAWPWQWREKTRKGEWEWPVDVMIVRIKPKGRKLDKEENLTGALKGVKDQVTDELGLKDDSDERLRWHFGQEIGAWGVRVEVVDEGKRRRMATLERLRALGPLPTSVLACAEAPVRDGDT